MRLRRPKIAAFAVAWLYLFGYLLAFAHFVEEQHAPCPEHGSQHHIAESAEYAVAAGHDGPQLHAGTPVDDDHCQLLQFFRSSSFTLDPPVSVADAGEPLTDPLRSLERTSFTVADSARWRFAPKQSPPSPA